MPSKRKSTRRSASNANLEVEEEVVHLEDDGTVESSLKPPSRTNGSVNGRERERPSRKGKRLSTPVPVEPGSVVTEPAAEGSVNASAGEKSPTNNSGTPRSNRRKPRSERNKSERTVTSHESADAAAKARSKPARFDALLASVSKSPKRKSGPEVATDDNRAAAPAAAKRDSCSEVMEDDSKPSPAAMKKKPPPNSKPPPPSSPNSKSSSSPSRRKSGPEIDVGAASTSPDGKVRGEEQDGKPKAVVTPGAVRVRPSASMDSDAAASLHDEDIIPDAAVEVSKSASVPPSQERNQDQPSKAGWQDTGLEDSRNRLDYSQSQRTSAAAAAPASASIPIAAELAPDDDEIERRMQERLRKELEKRQKQHVVAEAIHIDEEQSLAVVGGDRSVAGHVSMAAAPSSPTPESSSSKSRRKLYIAGGVVLLLVIVIGIIAGVVAGKSNDSNTPAPTMGPTVVTTDSYKDMVDAIGSIVSSDTAVFFESTETVQYQSMDWLANVDTWASAEMREPEVLAERYALAVLYYATDGPRWTDQYSFLSNSSVCLWNDGTDEWASELTTIEDQGFGVYCRPSGFVQEIHLEPAALQGYLPTELGLFPHLSSVDLTRAFLDGTIPSEIFSASNLTVLLLHETEGLGGSLPTEIGQATNLENLGLSQNRLLGSLPKELFDLTQLVALDLYLNSFAGEIPREIGKLSQLDYLGLDFNKFKGPIPEEIFGLKLLTYLNFFTNQLSGTLSSQIGLLTGLEYFDVGDNNLRGPLPSELGRNVGLASLYLENNDFEGTVPTELAQLTDLEDFSVNGNAGLAGFVSPGFARLPLGSVRLEGTDIVGVEEVFCAAGQDYDLMSADCGGVEPKVECTCCTDCCINGDDCE